MKKLFSLFLALVLLCSLIPAASAANTEAQQAAEKLYELGLFKGTGANADGSPIFDLDKTPTRNQAVIMLVRLLGKEDEALAGNWELPFTDVAKGSTVYPYLGYAYANGLAFGYTLTEYRGGLPIRANQYITFVLRALGYESGKDFEVGTAWDFSDALGITKGQYTAANAGSFLRGGIAEISCSALSAKVKGTQQTLLEKLQAENAVGINSFNAWYEISEDGKLSIKTDYDIFCKDGYWVLIDIAFRDGSHSHDSQDCHYSLPADYDATSLLAYGRSNTQVSSITYSLYKDAADVSKREEFWDVWNQTSSKEQALAAFEDQLVMRAVVRTPILIEQTNDSFALTEFSLVRDEAKQQETYTAKISTPILAVGEYGLLYESRSGGQLAGMTYIGRGSNCLTFTREIDHFATNGSSGTFFISYNCFTQQADGSILCKVSHSTGLNYTIQ